MDERRLSVKEIREFMAAELFFGLLLFLRYYEAWVNLMNGTVLAFSYKYGFISRGLVGTFYQWLDRVLPFDMMRYQAVVNYTLIVTMIFYGVMAGFFVLCLRRGVGQIRYIILFFTIFMVPFSAAHFNFGRPDVYCLMLSTLAAVLLIKERAQWLVVPIAAVGVMIHQGNVFMYLNIILVLLLYRIFSSSGKRRRYYVILLIASFLVASALFLWFELFSHGGGQAIYDEVVETARHLTRKGNIHEDLVDKEILGIDLTDREVEDHRANFVQFAFFALMMLPYIFFLVRFFRELIRGGYAPDTPAAIVYKATWPDEKVLRCTVETLEETARAEHVTKTALIIAGRVLDGDYERSKLYDPGFTTEFREAVPGKTEDPGKE